MSKRAQHTCAAASARLGLPVPVMRSVRGAGGHQLEVLDPVVAADVIDVVDDLGRIEQPAEVLLDH